MFLRSARGDTPVFIALYGIVFALVFFKLSHIFLTYKKCCLKGHGNEADFLGFLQKLVPHRSLTLAELGSRRLPDSGSRLLNV
jgi:hypothetical protein